MTYLSPTPTSFLSLPCFKSYSSCVSSPWKLILCIYLINIQLSICLST